MANFETYVDIGPGEFIENCSRREIKELVDILIEEGHLNGLLVTSDRHHNLLDEEWMEIISKIMKSRLLLSDEEESLIKNIANRF